ncbi:hypothetical protein BX667DRAFT_313016 [Coemansia mojavensis]|nr:hypothetical protein BX667DRAFT_313016 [Coemansia mojavensis]
MSTSSEDGNTKPVNKGVIVGIFFGVTAPSIFIFLWAVCICIKFKWKRRRRERQQRQQREEEEEQPQLPPEQNNAEVEPNNFIGAFPEENESLQGLTENEIAQLPQHTFNALSVSSSSYETDKMCMVCLCDYEKKDKLVTLACRHSFHVDCAISWLRSNARCPLCSGPPLEPKEPPKVHIAIDM